MKTGSQGFHTWTIAEVLQYAKKHPIGTKAHLALALLLFTGQRRSDVVKFGRQHIKNGWLTFTGACIAAENGAAEKQLMAIFGWQTMKEAAHYTKMANKNVSPRARYRSCPSIKPRTIVSHFWARLKKVGVKGGKNRGRSKPDLRHGAQGRNRTTDTAIFSRMLYQLSYLGRSLAGKKARRAGGL